MDKVTPIVGQQLGCTSNKIFGGLFNWLAELRDNRVDFSISI